MLEGIDHGRTNVVGGTTKISAKRQGQNAIMITGAHIVQGGTIASSIAEKDKESKKDLQ